MIREAIGFGSTIEEAKEKAIADLGASELDDIQFEIISMPKKKVLGVFGGAKAQVKAFVELPDKKPVQKKKTAKPQPKKKKPQSVAPVKEKAEPKKKTEETEYSEPVDQSEIDKASPTGKAIEYIKSVLTALDCKDISIKAAFRENASLIILEGEDISILIGRRGETLDSLQYLASLVANNGGGHYRISLNIGNYRQKREETLIALANRISAQVLKTGKNRTLEPMNPYERRIIHTAVQAVDGVVSVSFGEGTARRVVIAREGSEIRPLRSNNRRGGRRQGTSSRSKTEAVSAPAREPKKDSDIPLYGKIN